MAGKNYSRHDGECQIGTQLVSSEAASTWSSFVLLNKASQVFF